VKGKMVLNWTSEVIVEIFTSVIILVATLLMYITPRTKNVKSLSYIRLGIFFMGMLFALDVLANLFLITLLSRISGLMLFPSAVLFAIGINYTIKETSNSSFLIIVVGLGVLFCYLAFQPGAIGFEFEGGHLNVNWIGLYELVGSFFIFFVGSASFYWGLKTWLNAPFLIKREAFIFFMGTVISGPVTLILYLFYYWNPIFILFAYATTGLGILIFCLVILKEPKLLYKSIFTTFLNTVQLMSEEVINKGGLLDIKLEEGILTLYKSELISVGLVASNYSKLLRECVVQFTRDFEQKFERELKKQVKDIAQYEGAFELIEKYFSNFPYKIIKNKKQPLLLAGKFAKIPLEIENRLSNIFTDEKEYQAIKTELLKSPLGLSSEFFTLYNDLIDETKRISEEKSLYLNDNNDLDV
jgi:hypothetical protein